MSASRQPSARPLPVARLPWSEATGDRWSVRCAYGEVPYDRTGRSHRRSPVPAAIRPPAHHSPEGSRESPSQPSVLRRCLDPLRRSDIGAGPAPPRGAVEPRHALPGLVGARRGLPCHRAGLRDARRSAADPHPAAGPVPRTDGHPAVHGDAGGRPAPPHRAGDDGGAGVHDHPALAPAAERDAGAFGGAARPAGHRDDPRSGHAAAGLRRLAPRAGPADGARAARQPRLARRAHHPRHAAGGPRQGGGPRGGRASRHRRRRGRAGAGGVPADGTRRRRGARLGRRLALARPGGHAEPGLGDVLQAGGRAGAAPGRRGPFVGAVGVDGVPVRRGRGRSRRGWRPGVRSRGAGRRGAAGGSARCRAPEGRRGRRRRPGSCRR